MTDIVSKRLTVRIFCVSKITGSAGKEGIQNLNSVIATHNDLFFVY